MSNHNHNGSIWSNVLNGAHVRSEPNGDAPITNTLPAGTSLIVLCYSKGPQDVSFTAPDGHKYTNKFWDFVVTDDQDRGGFVADVLVNAGGDIDQQLGGQGTCKLLGQYLANLPS
jgi:hypothetical protein